MRCRFGGLSIVFKQGLSPFATRWRLASQQVKERVMSKMIFVSLPVTDLKASMAFYESIGFKNNPQFTDETAACMVWSEAINFMLLTHAKWRTFTSRPIPPKTSSEVMLALSCDSRDAVDAMNGAAAANGGTADINPIEDHGFMYTRDLADPDGHALGAMWMDLRMRRGGSIQDGIGCRQSQGCHGSGKAVEARRDFLHPLLDRRDAVVERRVSSRLHHPSWRLRDPRRLSLVPCHALDVSAHA